MELKDMNITIKGRKASGAHLPGLRVAMLTEVTLRR